MSIKLVSFGTTSIQALRRISLDSNLLTTLGLKIGDLVQVELNTEDGTIVLKPAGGTVEVNGLSRVR